MKKTLATILFTLIIQILFADIPSGYYSTATGSSYTLKTQLHNIIKTGHNAQGYGDLYDAYVDGDTDPDDGYVWDMYSENPGGTDPYNYEHYNNNCGNYSTEGDCLNREHLFPQGIFNEALPMKTDYHHVVPSDGKVNGYRSNYPFGEVGSASWISLNGSKLGTCNYPGYAGTVFEPIDEFKGDIARCMLYFATRYEDEVASWSHTMLNGTSNQVYADWFISLLVSWHIQDPVDAKDNMRNEAGYTFQGNRNPFIDHPEYVTQIWGGGGNIIPSISNIIINPEHPTSSDNVNISATITDYDGNIESAELHWGISSGSLINTITLTNSSGNTYTTNSSIPMQDDGITIYFEIEATDDEPETKTTSELSYEVSDNPTITILSEDFSSCPASGWTTYNIASNEDWSCIGGSMEINAYGSDAACDDWLISPAMDLNSYSNEILTFTSWTRFSDTNNPPVELKYSTNYSGSGDPTNFQWTNLSTVWSGQDSQSTTGSGNIDLSSITGNSVYIAIKYVSSGTEAGSSAWWKVDDFLITGKNAISGNNLPAISNIDFNPEIPSSTENVLISATITDSDGFISYSNIKWGTSSGSYPNTISMSNTNNDYSGEIPKQTNGISVYFIIQATDNEAGNKQTSEYNYTVNNLPVISDVIINPENPTDINAVNITATITDTDGSISSANLKWGTESDSYTNSISMSNSGDNFSGEIPMQSNGTSVYFIIQATDNKAENKQTIEYNYTVSDLPIISDIVINPENPTDNDAVVITAIITDSDGSISSANLMWGNATSSYSNSISMSNSGDEYSGEIPQQSAGTTIYFKIEATDNLSKKVNFSGNYSVSESTGEIELSIANLKIYPNPVKENLNIKLSDGEIIQRIELFNIVGEKVLEVSDINSFELTLDISTFTKGIYFIKIDTENSNFIKKVILN